MISLPTPELEAGPFGPPDGARADLDDIRRNFVRFRSHADRDDGETGPTIRSPRVIVGKKGVGKTVYLRQFQAAASDRDSVYADEVRHDVPATEDVIKVCELYPAELAAEAWQWIWRRAILRSLTSHLLHSEALRDRIDPGAKAQLTGEFAPLLGTFRKPRSVYAEARGTATEARTRDGLARELRHRDWEDIEDLLGEIVAELPPICLYLDSVDERFGSAPLYWLQCQKGLCYQVLELLRDPRFGNKLHIVVAIRDLVRSSLLQGENATRYTGVPQIRVLDWDHRAIQEFLYQKLRKLPAEFRMDQRKDGVSGWLGRDEIYNPSRGIVERLEDYLLRHTRLIPRDVVQLGNALSLAVRDAKLARRTSLGNDTIREAVSDVSKLFADEQVAVCANHLASDTVPAVAAQHGYSEFYTSHLYAEAVQEELCRFIATVGTDRFTMSKLTQALELTPDTDVLSRHQYPLDVLWQNGLLGYEPDDDAQRSHFYGAHDVADFHLPSQFGTYVFHPILAHKVRIQAAGDRPVRGFA
jgi:hypothetical protein